MLLFHPCVLLEGKIPFLGEVGTEEFLMKLTSQITEMVSAKITHGKDMSRAYDQIHTMLYACTTDVRWDRH